MQYKVNWKVKAVKQLLKIVAPDRRRITTAVCDLGDSEKWHNVKALVNYQYDYRLRVGNYRILFNCEKEIRVVQIEEVKKRDERTY